MNRRIASVAALLFALLAVGTAWAQSVTDAQARRQPGRLLSDVELAQQPLYTDLSAAMVNPERVYKLSLTGQKLKSFPLEVLMFPNLQVLNLSQNRIDSLPPEINVLQNLQDLNLMGNRLTRLPNEINDLQNLHSLYLSRNRLHKFPHTMRGMQKLRFLDVTYNDLLIFELDWVRSVLPNCIVKY
jgi:Leucine-rich repeat (LRR) protein